MYVMTVKVNTYNTLLCHYHCLSEDWLEIMRFVVIILFSSFYLQQINSKGQLTTRLLDQCVTCQRLLAVFT